MLSQLRELQGRLLRRILRIGRKSEGLMEPRLQIAMREQVYALTVAASTPPQSLPEVAATLALMSGAAELLPAAPEEERESLLEVLSDVSETVRGACADEAPMTARRLHSGPRTEATNGWREGLAHLVDLDAHIYERSRKWAASPALESLALEYGRALLQLIAWGGEGDIQTCIGIAQELLEACFARGEYDSPETIMAFELLGDAHQLRTLGDRIENLECSARAYQSCIRRIGDRTNFVRNSILAKLSDVSMLLASLGQIHWWRETFGALEEMIGNIGDVPPSVLAGRQTQTASILSEFAENAPLMPAERRHIATRAMALADEVLSDPEAVSEDARSALQAILLWAAVAVHSALGTRVLHWALKRVESSNSGSFPWIGEAQESVHVHERRILAEALAFSRVRKNLLQAAEILEQDLAGKSGDERGRDHLLLAAINYAILHDGLQLRLEHAKHHLLAGLPLHTGPQSGLLAQWFQELGTRLDALRREIERPRGPTGRDGPTFLIARPGPKAKSDTQTPEQGLWTVAIEFRRVPCEGPLRAVAEGPPQTEYTIEDACPACNSPYRWTAHVLVDEEAHPDLFASMMEPTFHAHLCNSCGSELQFLFPLYVQRRWAHYPCLMVLKKADDPGPLETSIAAVKRYLIGRLPPSVAGKLDRALPVPIDVFFDWVTITNETPAETLPTPLPAVKIRAQSETDAGIAEAALLTDDDPPAFLGASRDGYDHRLDLVTRFPRHSEYRRLELISWLDAPDSEALLERRDAQAVMPHGDMLVFDDMIRCGMPLVRSGFSAYHRAALDELDRKAAQLIARDRAVVGHQRAAAVVRDAVAGRGRFVLFLRSFSLEIPKLRPEQIIADPYGFERDRQFGFAYAFGDTFQDEAAAHIHAAVPVVGISDRLAVWRSESPEGQFSKFRVKSSEWEDVASLLIEQATWIVLFLFDVGAGTRRELQEIEIFGAESKTGVFLFNRYFVEIGPDFLERFESAIEGETWHSAFEDPGYAGRFAFVHSYSKDDETWKRRLDSLVRGEPTS